MEKLYSVFRHQVKVVTAAGAEERSSQAFAEHFELFHFLCGRLTSSSVAQRPPLRTPYPTPSTTEARFGFLQNVRLSCKQNRAKQTSCSAAASAKGVAKYRCSRCFKIRRNGRRQIEETKQQISPCQDELCGRGLCDLV